MDAAAAPDAYLVYVWIRDIHPLLWRRVLVRTDSTLADLHWVFQIAFGWTDFHLHRFRLRKTDYAIPRHGLMEGHDARQVRLADLAFRPNERFLYEYDFGNLWQLEVRIEQRVPIERRRTVPVCIGGHWGGPPEDCGGPAAFLEQRDAAPWRVQELLGAVADAVTAKDIEALDSPLEELATWREWLTVYHFDRRRESPPPAIRPRRRRLAGRGGRGAMRLTVQVVIEADGGAREVIEEVVTLTRGALRVEEFGLTLAEAKTMLQGVQQALVTHQAAEALAAHADCPDCGRVRSQKGHNTLVVRTLFGKLHLPSPRRYRCPCRPRESRSCSPLAEVLPDRTTPELAYLESKFAALVSYGVTVDLWAEVLPLGGAITVASLHRTLQRVGTRIDRDLGAEQDQFLDGCQRDWDDLPPPGPPLTVGLDGGFVHAKDQPSRHEGWFEVIAGKSVPADGAGKCFAYVQNYDTKPKRRLFELLKSQGLQANQQVTFLSDGADDVREVPMDLSPESEHWLDWFHITMRLTVLRQLAKGLEGAPVPTEDGDSEEQDESTPIDAPEMTAQLNRVKWFLWHGNVPRALEILADLDDDLDLLPAPGDCSRKLLKTLREFQGYIALNRTYIPNYGDRYRHGEAISTAFAESSINQVVSKRMVKRQQMRWSERGAHHLLQVRTKVLNGDFQATFGRWDPGMCAEPEGEREELRKAA